MGYESRLIVGEATDLRRQPPQWIAVEATFDLGKLGWETPWSDLLERHKAPADPEWFFYATDGNTQVTTDPYGEHLRTLPVDEVLEALDACGPDFPRAAACAAWLRAWTWTRNKLVLHYGH